MADRAQLNEGLTNVEKSQSDLITNLTTLITEMTNAFNRFLAKLAAGNDYQAEVDKLTALNQQLADANVKVQSAISQAQVEGV